MNIKQLYYFTIIAETKSFTTAAQKLNLSQPPLSKQIILLEEEIGLKLMNRSSKKVELTEAGSFLYLKAKNILSMMDATLSQLQDFQENPKSILKLGTISSSGNLLINNFISDFCREYPQITFEITEGTTYELLEKLRHGIIECAIVRTPFNGEGFCCIYGNKEPLVAVGDGKFFENIKDKEIPLTALKNKPLIYYRRFETIINLAFEKVGVKPYIFCKTDDARTSLLWAGTGLGIALVPESISKLSITGSMTVKTILSEETTTKMAAIYKKDSYLSNGTKSFIDFFKERVIKEK